MVDPTLARSANREFLDTYLEYGIGHYYTVAKMLAGQDWSQLNEVEKQSAGIELGALASSSLENLIRWYFAVGKWVRSDTQALLVQVLQETIASDEMREEALGEVSSTNANEFCLSLGIPWRRDELRARRVDSENWLYTVDQAKANIAKALEDLVPAREDTPRAWVLEYLNRLKQTYVQGAGESNAAASVTIPQQASGADGDGAFGSMPRDPEARAELTGLIGNATVGLFLLIRLAYIAVFSLEPRSPSFVLIWQDMHPTSSPARGA